MKTLWGMMFFGAAVIAGLTAAQSPKNLSRYTVKIPMSDYRDHYQEIRQAGIDIGGMNIQKGRVDLLANESEIATLRSMGVTVPMMPLEAMLNEAPDAKYKTPDQVATILQGFQQKYPDLAQVQSIGKSTQGRDILVIRITQNVSQPDGKKPAVLYNGMHHAREVMSTEVPLDIAEYLLTNYGKDAKVTHWLNSDVVYVVPMLNVDGNNLVWTQENMWGKNANGVDINRNYPYAWNSCGGSSANQDADDYHGPSAGSEPETQALMNFVSKTKPVFDISYHSYSEIVIYPYGCGTHVETADVVEPLGKQMAALLPTDAGDGFYTAGLAPELLYPVDGDDMSWMYHEQHVLAYAIEVNSDEAGFQPSYDQYRDKTVTKNRAAWQLLLDRLDHATIQGQANPGAQIAHVESAGTGAKFVADYPVHADGSFFAVVNPGDYRVTFDRARAQTVHVNDSRVQFAAH